MNREHAETFLRLLAEAELRDPALRQRPAARSPDAPFTVRPAAMHRAAWALAEFSRHAPAAVRKMGLPAALGAIAAAGCVGAAAGGGGQSMVAFAAVAVLTAAADLSVQALLAVALLGNAYASLAMH